MGDDAYFEFGAISGRRSTVNERLQYWLKPAMTLLFLGVLMWWAPAAALDLWGLLSPKKIVTMIFALALVHIFGSTMTQYLGARTSSILNGFFGGLVSSTATTASLARRSKLSTSTDISDEILIFLSATLAMLFEGVVLVVAGTTESHVSFLIVFVGPILVTITVIFLHSRNQKGRRGTVSSSTFKILPILKLAAFIVAILSVSKIFQTVFGKNGLLVLTGLVSLFEIHGSIIANIQLHESGVITVKFLCSLLAISIVASYLSKLFLISTLGSHLLRAYAFRITLLLFFSLALSWAAAIV